MAIKRKNEDSNRVIVDKLRHDVGNKLQYWLKKVPRYNELIFLIAEAGKQFQDSSILEEELRTLKRLFDINSPKKLTAEELNVNKERLEKVYQSFEFIKLISIKKHQKKKISKHTPHWYTKQIDLFRNSKELSENVHSDVSLSFSSMSSNVYCENYEEICESVAKFLSTDVDKIKAMKTSVIKSKLTKYFSENFDVEKMKIDLLETETKITTYIQNSIQKPDIANVIFYAFGDINNEKTEAILKEIMFSINIINVYRISGYVAKSTKNLHNNSDAIGFGMEGLTKAVNKWYETQILVQQPLSFDAFMYKYVKHDVHNGLQELKQIGTIKASNYNSIRNQNEQEIENFIKNNPQYSHLDRESLFDMLQPHSKKMKRVGYVNNESSILGHVESSNSDRETDIDIFKDSEQEFLNPNEMLEAQIEYEKMMEAVNKIFNCGKLEIDDYNFYDEPLYFETEEKMFTEYDKILFLMEIGFNYNHETNKPYTLKEMGDVLKLLYKKNGIISNRLGEEISFGNSSISVRLKKIKENIRMVLQHKPHLLKGFNYFVNIIDGDTFQLQNISHLNFMSNKRENTNSNILK